MSLLDGMEEVGYVHIEPEHYLFDPEQKKALEEIEIIFQTQLRPDGPRKRGYLKLEWQRESGLIGANNNQNYFQSKENNQEDGGKIRQFTKIPESILANPVINALVTNNVDLISQYLPLQNESSLILGLHFIRFRKIFFVS